MEINKNRDFSRILREKKNEKEITNSVLDWKWIESR